MNVEKLIEQYNALPYIEKRIVQLNVFAKPNITRTDFLKIINQSDLKVSLGKQYTNIAITPIIDSLNSKKLLQQNNCCLLILHHVLMDSVNGEYSEKNIHSILSVVNNHSYLIDKLNCGIYLNNIILFEQAIKEISVNNHKKIILRLTSIYSAISLDSDWISRLLPEIQYWVIASKIYSILQGSYTNIDQEIITIKQIIKAKLDRWIISSDFIFDLFLDFHLLNGDLDNIRYLTTIVTHPVKHPAIFGILYFLEDDTNKALVNFDIAIKAIKDTSKKRNVSLSGIYGICHILSLLKQDNSKNLWQIEDLIKNYKILEVSYNKDVARLDRYYYEKESLPEITKYFTPEHRSSYNLLIVLTNFLKLGSSRTDDAISVVLKYADEKLDNVLDEFIVFLVSYWTKSKAVDLKQYSLELHKRYDGILLGLESVIKRYLDSIDKDSPETQEDSLAQASAYIPYNFDFTAIIRIKPEWERTFATLLSHFDKHGSGKKNDINDTRLVWMVYPRRTVDIVIPFEQKKLANGSWNKGRPISLKRLSENRHNLNYLNQCDHLAIKSIERINSYYSNNYCINNDKALLALTNHTLIFDGDSGEHIELTKTSPELVVKEGKNNYLITLSTYSDTNKVKLQKEGENRYQVVEISQPILEIMKIIGKNGVSVPKSEKERILSLIKSAASNVSIRTELNMEAIDTVAGDSSLIVQLILVETILKLRLFVRPFSGKGSYYKPGKGNVNIAAQIDNIYKSVNRNLSQERGKVTQLLDQCPTLSERDNNDYEWKIDELETSLEILYELNNYKIKHPNDIIIEWPHGQSIFLDRELSFDHLKLNITSNNQWFTFDGEIEIKEDQVMEMRDLLTKLDQSKGRFIELSDKRFVSLTESFVKRLQELNVASKIDNIDDKSYNIHKLAAPLLLEFAEKSKNIKTDSNWQNHINKISLIEKYDPIISNNLQAQLRPYQIEGFKWLSRLTNLGFGACLADDMGLGKTVQTIALLLEQASIGPCLVVAPASVCYVWEEECKKFAPSLNCISITTTNEREEQINNLAKMDVLVCSYGVLYQMEDLVINKEFQLVVLDEAQAIKNFNTKRFKIITQLKAINRIALSGTPIENRTEELWNLFEFLNPGFLGSRQLFQQKYTRPIELDKNITVRNTLKRLIQPFILRRIKSKVLDELPPKIEQTIFIEPTDQEKNFYEALRRESIERISNLTEASEAQKRFSILAEITKLRRACCDSSLVDNKIELPNSKLEALDEIIKELKENNHRALVFSQYVGYLDIVRKRLDAQKITYQYLDGSNTQKQRQSSVEAFQSGEGDLFLISLKAGGVGLNLTSADYVIHLDPWWNPAIEDQASDRAHRMGQTRPVTIYRLVMKYSIEEKILKMHHDKRDLAISLLSDSDKSASLNQNDLLELITTSYMSKSSYNVTGGHDINSTDEGTIESA